MKRIFIVLLSSLLTFILCTSCASEVIDNAEAAIEDALDTAPDEETREIITGPVTSYTLSGTYMEYHDSKSEMNDNNAWNNPDTPEEALAEFAENINNISRMVFEGNQVTIYIDGEEHGPFSYTISETDMENLYPIYALDIDMSLLTSARALGKISGKYGIELGLERTLFDMETLEEYSEGSTDTASELWIKDGYAPPLDNSIRAVILNSTANFSEDHAWVRHSVPRTLYTSEGVALSFIDNQGQILWESEAAIDNDSITSECKDGLTYCVVELADRSGRIINYILDADGNVTYETDQEDFVILGHGDGKFLAAQFVSNFDEKEWKIGAIDKNGTTVVPFTIYAESFSALSSLELIKNSGGDPKAAYIGNGVFSLGASSNINLETQRLEYRDDPWPNPSTEEVLNEDSFHTTNSVDIADLNNKTYVVGPFHNGYAAVLVEGADEGLYFTATDQSGKIMFEPQPDCRSVFINQDGKYIIAMTGEGTSVFDINGSKLITIDSKSPYVPVSIDDRELGITSGLLRLGRCYVDINNGNILGRTENRVSVTVHSASTLENDQAIVTTEISDVEEEPTQSDPGTERSGSMRVKTPDGSPLRLREGPGTEYDIIMEIPDGERVLLEDGIDVDGWLNVTYVFSGRGYEMGWVSAEYLVQNVD